MFLRQESFCAAAWAEHMRIEYTTLAHKSIDKMNQQELMEHLTLQVPLINTYYQHVVYQFLILYLQKQSMM